jgi:hypothetical protein
MATLKAGDDCEIKTRVGHRRGKVVGVVPAGGGFYEAVPALAGVDVPNERRRGDGVEPFDRYVIRVETRKRGVEFFSRKVRSFDRAIRLQKLRGVHGWKESTCDGSGEPDYSRKCQCGQTPVVPEADMCGPCTFGEAGTAGGEW